MPAVPDHGYQPDEESRAEDFWNGELNTKDQSTPLIRLENIAHSVEVKRMLSNLIEKEREEKKVVGRDMYGAAGHLDDIEYGNEPQDLDL